MKYLCIIRAHQRNWVQALGGNTCAFELLGQVNGLRASVLRAYPRMPSQPRSSTGS